VTWVPLGASRLASIQQFKRASKDGQLPVLIRAGFATDRALTTWQPEILEERYGEAWIRVHVQHSKFNIHEWTRDRKAYASKFPDRRMSIRGMKLRRFLQGLKKRGPTQIIRSIAGISIEELSRGQHPPLPKFCRRLGCTFVTAWSAAPG